MKRCFTYILLFCLLCLEGMAQVDLPYFSSFETAAERADWYYDDYGGANWEYAHNDSVAYTGTRFVLSVFPGVRTKASDKPSLFTEIMGQQESNRLYSPLYYLPVVEDAATQQILTSVYLAALDDEYLKLVDFPNKQNVLYRRANARFDHTQALFRIFAIIDNERVEMILDTTALSVRDLWQGFQFDVSEYGGHLFQVVVEHLPYSGALMMDDFGFSSTGIDGCPEVVAPSAGSSNVLPLVQDFPYEEGFESGFACWQSDKWEVVVGYGDYSNQAVSSWGVDDEDYPVRVDNWLYSPAFILPATQHIDFSWQEMGSGEVHYQLYVSTELDKDKIAGGKHYDFGSGVDEWYVSRNVDLSQFAGRAVRLAFRHYGVGSTLILDDVAMRTSTDLYTVRYMPGVDVSYKQVSGTMTPPLIRYPERYIVDSCAFVYPGHKFVCWEATPYIGTDYIPAGQVIDSLDKNLTLNAVWVTVDSAVADTMPLLAAVADSSNTAATHPADVVLLDTISDLQPVWVGSGDHKRRLYSTSKLPQLDVDAMLASFTTISDTAHFGHIPTRSMQGSRGIIARQVRSIRVRKAKFREPLDLPRLYARGVDTIMADALAATQPRFDESRVEPLALASFDSRRMMDSLTRAVTSRLRDPVRVIDLPSLDVAAALAAATPSTAVALFDSTSVDKCTNCKFPRLKSARLTAMIDAHVSKAPELFCTARNIQVLYYTAKKPRITVYDIFGRIVKIEEDIIHTSDFNSIIVGLSSMRKGCYLVHVSFGDGVIMRRLNVM